MLIGQINPSACSVTHTHTHTHTHTQIHTHRVHMVKLRLKKVNLENQIPQKEIRDSFSNLL